MSPSGGYLFLYPGSISRIFLFGTSHYLYCLLSAELTNQSRCLRDAPQATIALQRAIRRPIEFGREFTEGRGEILPIAPRRARLFHHVGCNLHKRVHADRLTQQVLARVVPLIRQDERDGGPELAHDCCRFVNLSAFEDLASLEKVADCFLHRVQ